VDLKGSQTSSARCHPSSEEQELSSSSSARRPKWFEKTMKVLMFCSSDRYFHIGLCLTCGSRH
jgi:hypothetical protein